MKGEVKGYNKAYAKAQRRSLIKRSIPFYLMLIPGVVLVLLFNYLPLYGYRIAFQKFIPAKGFFGNQQWRGLYYFNFILNSSDFTNAFRNTLTISFMKLIAMNVVAILFTLLLNEVQNSKLKRTIQTVVYFPHFMSWIILSYVFIDLLAMDGMVNRFLGLFGVQPIFFLGSNQYFQGTLVVTDVWKEFGFNSIVFLAAITSIDPSLYESAVIDGANRFQQFMNIILPSIKTIITLNVILSITGSLSAFEPPFVITKGGNGTATYFIIMDRIAHTSQKVGLASAMAVFLLCIIFVVTILQKLFFKYVFRNAGTDSKTGGDVL